MWLAADAEFGQISNILVLALYLKIATNSFTAVLHVKTAVIFSLIDFSKR